MGERSGAVWGGVVLSNTTDNPPIPRLRRHIAPQFQPSVGSPQEHCLLHFFFERPWFETAPKRQVWPALWGVCVAWCGRVRVSRCIRLPWFIFSLMTWRRAFQGASCVTSQSKHTCPFPRVCSDAMSKRCKQSLTVCEIAKARARTRTGEKSHTTQNLFFGIFEVPLLVKGFFLRE